MTALNKSDGFHQVRNQESIDDEAGSIDTLHSGLVHGFAPVEHSLEYLIRSVIRFDDFEKLHHWNGVKEMETAKSSGILYVQ